MHFTLFILEEYGTTITQKLVHIKIMHQRFIDQVLNLRDNFIFVPPFHLILFRTNFNSSTCNLIINKYFSISSFQIFQNCSINIMTPCIECRYDGAGGWRGPEGGSPADTNSDSGTVAQFVFVGPCGRFVVVEFSYQN